MHISTAFRHSHKMTGFIHRLNLGFRAIVLNRSNERLNLGLQIRVELELFLYLLARVHNRSMVASAKLEAEFGSGVFRNFPGYVHGDLTRQDDVLRSFFALYIAIGKLIVICDDAENIIDSHVTVLRLAEYVLELVLSYLECNVLMDELGIGYELGQGRFEVSDVRGYVLGDDVYDLVGDADATRGHLFFQDS